MKTKNKTQKQVYNQPVGTYISESQKQEFYKFCRREGCGPDELIRHFIVQLIEA